MSFFEKDLALAKKAALEAGEAVMRYFKSTNFEIKNKGVNNPVTTADFEANNIIKEILINNDTSFGWLSEETVDSQERIKKENVWVVDPIDGTKEFIEGVPHFSISIGMVSKGEPVVGVIYNPAKNELFTACSGGGSKLNGEPINCLSKNNERTIMVSRSEIKRGMWDAYKKIFLDIIPVGSVAYKLGLIAAGRSNLFATLQPKNEWDVCAGNCIINEAGGNLLDLYGNERLYNSVDTKISPGLIAGHSNYVLKALEAINI